METEKKHAPEAEESGEIKTQKSRKHKNEILTDQKETQDTNTGHSLCKNTETDPEVEQHQAPASPRGMRTLTDGDRPRKKDTRARGGRRPDLDAKAQRPP
jgi:hypothetical protein